MFKNTKTIQIQKIPLKFQKMGNHGATSQTTKEGWKCCLEQSIGGLGSAQGGAPRRFLRYDTHNPNFWIKIGKIISPIFYAVISITQKLTLDSSLGWTKTPNGLISTTFQALIHGLTRCPIVCGLLFWKKGVFLDRPKITTKLARGRGVENRLDTENEAQLKPLGVMVNHFWC